jgi:hypothetical protein
VQEDGTLNTFLKSTPAPTPQTEILGLTSSSLSVTFTNSAIAIKYPMSFGDMVNDNMAGNFSAFTYSGTCSGSIVTKADGTGTLMLPNGVTLTNVLRVKSVQTLSFVDGFIPLASGKQTIYSYYHASKKFPVLTINYNTLTPITSTPTVSGVVTGSSDLFTVGIKEIKLDASALSMYPNPVAGILNIELSGQLQPKEIKLYTQVGQLVYQQNYVKTIDLSTLPSGIYFMEIKTEQGLIRKRLIKE